jgi:hypothetical protein
MLPGAPPRTARDEWGRVLRGNGCLRLAVDGVAVPQPAPRFSESPAVESAKTLEEVLRSWNVEFPDGNPAGGAT